MQSTHCLGVCEDNEGVDSTMNNIETIFGAPGCGKTTHLLSVLESVLTEYDPNRVAFVSFTKKGAYEGRDRAIKKYNFKEEDFPFFRTIHSLAFRDLEMSTYDMMSKKNYKEFSNAMGCNFLGYYTAELLHNDDKYLFYISMAKNNPKIAESMKDELNYQKLRTISTNYEKYKRSAGVKDFDDLLVDFIAKNEPLPVDVAIIDEAQDLTTLQWKFCEVAFRNVKKCYIAGDDDQAIYEWSGADVSRFISVARSSNILVLDKSYRLRENVLELSKLVSNKISDRIEKVFDPVDKGGNVIFHNRLEDVLINSEESYYFLARNNYYLSDYKNFIMKTGSVFRYKGSPSVSPSVVNAIREYEKARRDHPGQIHNIVVDKKIKPLLKKDAIIGEVWYDVFELTVQENLYYRDFFKNKTDMTKCKIDVDTIHGVKGGEADNVVLRLDITKNVYSNLVQGRYDEELRCLYVAMTRAKKNLHIIYSNSKFGYDNIIREVKYEQSCL